MSRGPQPRVSGRVESPAPRPDTVTDHGYGAYTHGCRCDACKAAKAEYMRGRRAEARSLAQKHTKTASGARGARWNAFATGSERHLASISHHGTRYAYEERGCRCEECTTARSESDRRYRADGVR